MSETENEAGDELNARQIGRWPSARRRVIA